MLTYILNLLVVIVSKYYCILSKVLQIHLRMLWRISLNILFIRCTVAPVRQ